MSNDLTDHTFNSFHKVPRRNDDQKAATRAVRETCLRVAEFLVSKYEVIDPYSPIYHLLERRHEILTAVNGRTNIYHVENPGGRYDGKFGCGGPDRPKYYISELGRDVFDRSITMTSIVDVDNIDKVVQQQVTAMLLNGLRPHACATIPVTVFDLVECSRTGLPAALQLIILLLDTPSEMCNDLGGIMEVNGYLKALVKLCNRVRHDAASSTEAKVSRQPPTARRVDALQQGWLRRGGPAARLFLDELSPGPASATNSQDTSQ